MRDHRQKTTTWTRLADLRRDDGRLLAAPAGGFARVRDQGLGALRRAALAPFVVAALLVATAAPPWAVAEEGARPGGRQLINGVVASVDGDPMTLRDLRIYRDTRTPFLPADQRGSYEAVLEAMIDSRLLAAEFETHGINAEERDVDTYIDRVLGRSKTSREDLTVALVESGITWEDYFERMREEVNRLELVDIVIRARVHVTDEEIERAWRTDPAYLETEKVKIAHIFLPIDPAAGPEELERARKQAQEIFERVRHGGFEAAAKEHSKGPTASDGGYLGAFERGTMATHFEVAVASLRRGQVSPPIEVAGGIHIVKLIGIRPPTRVPLETISNELHARLYDERMEKRYRRWASEDLREAHYITTQLEDLALLAGS